MSVPAHLQLLTPRQFAAQQIVTTASCVFRANTRLAPHRAAYEFYPTPPEATRALLSVESFDGPIWEPACGEGHISKVLEATGHSVVSTDLAPCWGYGTGGRDFLRCADPLAKHIVTNPPYGRGLADGFVKHALRMTRDTGGSVAMLLALQSLAHPLRHTFWASHPPAVIYILDECQCWPYGDPARATTAIGKQRYCWVVWKPDNNGPTILRWLSTRGFRRRETRATACAAAVSGCTSPAPAP
jgi:hypothetical protein